MATVRLTTAQALIRFLAAQHVERDGVEHRFFGGCFGIFGHGNVAGIGEALLAYPDVLPYHQARNEQGMVHTAVGYARMRNRLGTLVCTTSIGPGATNMVTGAALATINRLPVLLAPRATSSPRTGRTRCCSSSRTPSAGDVSVNDCFRPVSRYFDRISRPEQVIPAALQAMRVLTNPAETGAVTLAFPQDVQAEAFDFPDEFLAERVWHVPRPAADGEALARAVAAIRSAQRPLIVAGGGVIYSEATARCAPSARRRASRSARRRPARARCRTTIRRASARSARPARSRANRIAAEADLVIGIGTRYTDFTTASKTAFASRRSPLRQRQRRRLRRREARAAPRSSATRAPRSSSCGERSRAGAVDDAYRDEAARARTASGTRRWRASTRSGTSRSRPRAR